MTGGGSASKHALCSPLSAPDTKRSRVRSSGDICDVDGGGAQNAMTEQAGHYYPGGELQDEITYGAERDPLRFSYFLAANLPVPTTQLQRLLEAVDVVERLRWVGTNC
jgi:hypothetical protein